MHDDKYAQRGAGIRAGKKFNTSVDQHGQLNPAGAGVYNGLEVRHGEDPVVSEGLKYGGH